MKKQEEKLLKTCAWCTIILFAIRCMISFNEIILDFSLYELFGYAGEAIGLSVILTIFYEEFLWRYNPLEKTPKLSKKYTGTLKSSYDGIERSAVLEIKQSLLYIHITIITDESKSNSISASIDEVLGEKQLTYCYLNTPKSEYRYRSEIHYGTATLCVDNPNVLTGQYYTDRQTIGDMNFIPNT